MRSALVLVLAFFLAIVQPIAFAADGRAATRGDMAAHAAVMHASVGHGAVSSASAPCPHAADAATAHDLAAPADNVPAHDAGTCALVCAALALSVAVSPIPPLVSAPERSAKFESAERDAAGLRPTPPTPPPRAA